MDRPLQEVIADAVAKQLQELQSRMKQQQEEVLRDLQLRCNAQQQQHNATIEETRTCYDQQLQQQNHKLKAVHSRCDALQKQHENIQKSMAAEAKTLRQTALADQERLRKSFEDRDQEHAQLSEYHSKLVATNTILATALIDLGELLLQRNVATRRVDASTSQCPLTDTGAQRSEASVNVQLPTLRQTSHGSANTSDQSTMDLDVHEHQSLSSSTLRAASSERTETTHISERQPQGQKDTGALSTSSAAKRTASQRQSVSSLEQNLSPGYKRSQSLQRKRAKSNLKRLGKTGPDEMLEVVSEPKQPPSHRSLTAPGLEGGIENDLAHMTNDKSVERRCKVAFRSTPERSSASHELVANVAKEKAAAELLRPIAQNPGCFRPQCSSRSLRSHALIAPSQSSCSQSISQQTTNMTRGEPTLSSKDSSLPGLGEGSEPTRDSLRMPALQASNGGCSTMPDRRRSSRQLEKSLA